MDGNRRREKSARPPNLAAPGGVSLEMAVATDATDLRPLSAARVAPSDFDALFVMHYERLVRALTVIAGDRDRAADAVQEAFVKAHVRWRKVGGYEDPAGWVRRVAINKLNDEHRRTARKQRLLAVLRRQATESADDPDIDDFGRLLAELPRQQRAVTALFYVDGLPIAEIAEVLGISPGSVKSHLHDARARLRPILEQENEP